MKPVSVEGALIAITAALRQLRPPEWTRHEDFRDRPPTWWVDDMHPEWMAEEYLEHIVPSRSVLRRADRELVDKIGAQARDLADKMKRCRSMQLVDKYYHLVEDKGHKNSSVTFAVLYRSLDRLANAVESVEYEETSVPREVAVAQIAARHFARITWREPGLTVDKIDGKAKASGQFFDLVEAIFFALAITASAERNAKKAAAAHKSANASPSHGIPGMDTNEPNSPE